MNEWLEDDWNERWFSKAAAMEAKELRKWLHGTFDSPAVEQEQGAQTLVDIVPPNLRNVTPEK